MERDDPASLDRRRELRGQRALAWTRGARPSSDAQAPPAAQLPTLIQSRLRPPQPLLVLVRREQLLRRLTASAAPLVVVSAPGGYGKTVTLAQWASDDGVPFAWLQADAAHDDPLLFLQYVTAALGTVAEVDPQIQEWLRMASPPVEMRILPALAAAVAGSRPFAFIVDDVHLLTSEACWGVLGLLLDQLPAGAHLCLSGRVAPPLPLSRLRTQGRVLELGPGDLALSESETKALMDLHGVAADEETLAHLAAATEGWPAGLYLAVLAGDERSPREVVAGVRGDRHAVARYLATEVLEMQPPDVAGFLLETSILGRLSPGLCRAVTGDEQAGELLRFVALRNLFISALDDTDEWFRYHHLFAEFLQTELTRRRCEDEVAELHRRAAAWFEEHGALEEAVRHWLAGGEPGRAGVIVCRGVMDHCVRWATLRRWLEMLTDEQILADPLLTVAAGWVGSPTGDSPRVRIWLAGALRTDVGDTVWPGVPVPALAMQAGLRAMAAFDGVAAMRRDADLAIQLSGDAYSTPHSVMLVQLGISTWLSGESEEALGVLAEALNEAEAVNAYAAGAAHGIMTLVLGDLGRWEEAAEHAEAASRRIAEMGSGWSLLTLPVLWARARVRAHIGADPSDDVTAITDVVDEGLVPLLALITDVVVAELLFESGRLDEAAHWARAGSACLSAWPDAGILRGRLERLRQRLDERRLAEPLTPAETRVLQLLPTELSQQEIAKRLFTSHETVRTHTRDIYRKLEVHTRSQAVARARELGLLAPA